jgi:predicted restriction endonuclease
VAVARFFGDIPGVAEGVTFASRDELMAARVHRAKIAGIVGTGASGAESIVVSGGYEDDEDHGDVIIYTGHGGRDLNTGRQVADQSLEASGNAALVTSSLTGAPVRVVRGRNRKSKYAPVSGYRYDGLYRVERWWMTTGQRGFRVCLYRLVKLAAELPADATAAAMEPGAPPAGSATPPRSTTSVQRVIRSSVVSEYVKQLHDHTCQICGTRLVVRGRGYAEGAHIRALGRPHDGPDVAENLLCLCPNCHVLFDNGEILIDDDLMARTPAGSTPLHARHQVQLDYLRYHRSQYQ